MRNLLRELMPLIVNCVDFTVAALSPQDALWPYATVIKIIICHNGLTLYMQLPISLALTATGLSVHGSTLQVSSTLRSDVPSYKDCMAFQGTKLPKYSSISFQFIPGDIKHSSRLVCFLNGFAWCRKAIK